MESEARGPNGFDLELFADLTDVRILEKFECCICAGIQLDVKTTTSCQHSFCGGCIDKWLNKHDTCPLCRAPTPGPGDRNAVLADAASQQVIDSLPVRCTMMVVEKINAAATQEQGAAAVAAAEPSEAAVPRHRCGWLGVLGSRGETWRQHVMNEHGCADPIDAMKYVLEPVPVAVPNAELVRDLLLAILDLPAPPHPELFAARNVVVERRARWVALHAEREAALPAWSWASPLEDVIELADLERLLTDKVHPAHLSLARAEPDKPRMAYVHVWNERTQKFMRSCQIQTTNARSVGGLQQFAPQNHPRAAGDWSVSLVLEQEADARIIGPDGCLVRWMARQLATDYRLFFPTAGPHLDRMTIDARTAFFLDQCTPRGNQVAAQPGRPVPHPVLRLKLPTNQVLGSLPQVDVFRMPVAAAAAAARQPDLVYSIPYRGPGDTDDAFRARVAAKQFEDPAHLVQPWARADYAWVLMGAILLDSARWSLANRCTQILVQPVAPPRRIPEFLLRMAHPRPLADATSKDSDESNSSSNKRPRCK
jgi:hypothetical protein